MEKTHSQQSYVVREPGWLALIGLLFVARYLRPENAQFGDTLWISGLWLALTALWCWHRARLGDWSVRFGVLEALAMGLALAHALATIPIFLEGGDRRGAANVVWEWVGVAGSVFLIRQAADGPLLRRLVLIFAATTAALAGLGVWQYHVSIPGLAERYAELRAEEAMLAEDAGAADRLASVREELASFNAPVEESARLRWENRLRHSSEPFATFALANTLAGFLAAGLPLWLVGASSGRWSWWRLACGGLALLVLYCLILTKSRTAWAGLAVGMVMGMGWQLARRESLIRPAWLAGGLAGVVVLGFIIVGMAGGLDREVFSEAPKSLQYRLEYWEGTLAVLGEHPWLGTGPANFRGYYMQHRPLGASEAIAAPHNLFLEIWSAGGLLGLLLLLGLLGFVGRRLVQSRERGFDVRGGEYSPGLTVCEWGGLAAFIVVVAIYFVAGAAIDWRLVAIAPLFVIAASVLNSGQELRLLGMALVAGSAALLVHLLGADGIEYPVVIQTLFLFAMAIDGVPKSRLTTPMIGWALPVVWGALTAGLLMTGLAPVLNSSAHLMRAETLAASGQPGVEQAVEAAIAADPWSLRAPMMKAALETSRVMEPRGLADGSRGDRKRAIAAWREVLAADPRNVFARERIATVLLTGAEREENAELAGRAAEVLREAVELSPTEVGLWVELARALTMAGETDAAGEAARKALALDAVNRGRGHTDLLLEGSARNQLERWTELGQRAGSP